MYNRLTVISQFCLSMVSRHSIHFINGKIYFALTDSNFIDLVFQQHKKRQPNFYVADVFFYSFVNR